jgi:HPt (histidine-containing phosphotransfer) domain-containing protein
MSDDSGIEEKIRLMAQGFLARLPARFEKIDEAFVLCHVDLDNAENWMELRRLLHSLGGAAGTFGVPELGTQARAIETFIDKRLLEGDWNKADLDTVGAALVALQQGHQS